jgi:hypothetical protein
LNLHILLHVPVTDTVESRSEIVFEENIDSDLLNLDFENVQEITNQISKYERKENISVNSCETVMNMEYISVNLPVNSCETVMNKENISVNLPVNSCETVMKKENISVNLPVNSCETVMKKENIFSHPRFSMMSNASIGNATINIYGDNFKNS